MSRDTSLTPPVELKLEQQFRLQILRQDVKLLTLDEAQFFVVELSRQLMLKENHILQLEDVGVPEEVA